MDGQLRRLVDDVISAASKAGGRLPAERRLAEQLGCSRTRIRGIMAQLEQEGTVTRHVGRGTFVTPADAPPHRLPASFTPEAIMSASMVFEPQVVALAARAATEEDLAELHRCLEQADSADDYESFEQWDISLHRAFAVATHNAQILAMVDVLNSTRNNPVWGRLKRDGFTPQNRAAVHREHHAIVAALADRDHTRAAAAMTEHLRFVRKVVTGQ